MRVRRLIRQLLPLRCVFCDSRCQPYEGRICSGCCDDLPWCESLSGSNMAGMQAVYAPLRYEFPLDAALKQLKFRRRLEYAPAFAELLRRTSHRLPPDIDAVLPMPLHWRRQVRRGFNQARELALPLAQTRGLPILQDVRRVRATVSQSGLNATARQRNLRDAFAATRTIRAKHVLIVDDVITTGASCQQLAKAVRRAGANAVSALAVARR